MTLNLNPPGWTVHDGPPPGHNPATDPAFSAVLALHADWASATLPAGSAWTLDAAGNWVLAPHTMTWSDWLDAHTTGA